MHISGLWLQQGRPPRWHSGKESTYQCRRCKTQGFNPWVRKILRSWNWQHSPGFVPGKLDGQSSQTGYSPWGQKESIQLSDWACMHNYNRRFHCDRKSSVQFSSVTQSCPTLWTHGLKPIRPPCPSLTPGVYSNSCPLSRWCHPSTSSSIIPFSSLPQYLSHHQGLFKWVSSSQQVAKVLEFQLQHQSFQWIFRMISFRMDWLYFCAVQRTLKSLLWHHSSKASVLQCSAFFIVQLSHPCMTNGKTIALTTRNFVGKVMSLLFNMLSRLIIAFLPRSQCLLIGNYEPEEYRKKKEILNERDKKPWNRNEKRNQGSRGKSVQDFLLDDKSLRSSSLGQRELSL